MTKDQFLNRVLRACASENLSKRDVEMVAKSVFDQMAEAVCSEGRFSFSGFGTFNVTERAARTGRNPQTGQAIDIPAKAVVKFNAAPRFKQTLMPKP